jgi:hypothetical protein
MASHGARGRGTTKNEYMNEPSTKRETPIPIPIPDYQYQYLYQTTPTPIYQPANISTTNTNSLGFS